MARPDAAKPLVRDPGLQAERTALSWNRTALSIFVNALLALRAGWTSREAPITAPAFALLIASGAAMFYGAWRRRHLLDGQGPIAPSANVIAATAVVALVACVTGIASVVLN